MSQADDIATALDVLHGGRGASRVCTAVGQAGSGKSWVLRTIRQTWQEGGRTVVRVVGSELEQSTPLGTIDQLLSQVGRPLEPPPEHAVAAAGRENIERRALGAVLAVLDELASSDALLTIDDAHWIDETSQRVLDGALRRLDDEAPATLIAERPLRQLTQCGVRLPIRGLSLEETTELLTNADASPVKAIRLHELSNGNPLTLQQLLVIESTRVDDSESLERQLIRRRIDALEHPTQLALALLARRRIGDRVDAAWALLREGDAPGPRPLPAHMVDALRPAIDAGLVVGSSSSADFAHPEYRALATQAVDGSTQRAISMTLASTTADPGSASWHRLDATTGPDDEVSDLLAATARSFADRGAPIEAARAFEAAAASAADPAMVIERRIEAAEAWWFAGEPREVARVTADCDALPVEPIRRLRARQLHRIAVGWHRQVSATIRGLLDDAELAAEASTDVAAGMRLAAFIEACHAGQTDQAVSIASAFEAGLADEGSAGDDTLSGAAALCRSFGDLLAGRVARQSEAAQLLELAANLDPRKLDTAALNIVQIAGYAMTVLERWDLAAASLGDLAREGRRRGASVMVDFTDASLAELDRRRGHWASAMSRCTDDTTIDADHLAAGPTWQRAIRARILACRGDHRALAYAATVHDEAGPVGMSSLTTVADIARAMHSLNSGDADTAAELMAQVERVAIEGGSRETGVLWHELDAIESFHVAGRVDDLERITQRVEQHARACDRTWSHAMSSLGRFLLGRATADDALAAADRLEAPFEVCRIELLVLERLGADDPGTVQRLAQLRDRLARFGAHPFLDRVDALGRGDDARAGSSPAQIVTQHHVDLLASLTPAELRVAVSVASGNTNAEAARDLYLSVRTVEAHLRSIFRKLEVRNRVELATSMTGHL